MSILTLSITNLEQLLHNVSAWHRFGYAGGTVGSRGATWLMNDRNGGVAPIHCEIRWIEGSFCVIDRCQRTYLNDNLGSVGALGPRRLAAGDRLRIGAYRLQMQFSQVESCSLEDLISPERTSFDQWLLEAPTPAWRPALDGKQDAVDIESLFEPGHGNDPLAALDVVTAPDRQDPLERLIAGERP
ncbi:FHA domain-containing protein [Pseudomonas sp. MLB6B]